MTYPAHGFVQCQADSLDRDIPLLSFRGGLEEGAEDTSGNEASTADSDEECRF